MSDELSFKESRILIDLLDKQVHAISFFIRSIEKSGVASKQKEENIKYYTDLTSEYLNLKEKLLKIER